MRLFVIALTTALIAPPTIEQIDDETKAWALKRAYEINGNSMNRGGSIDLTKEIHLRHEIMEAEKALRHRAVPKDQKK